MENNYPFEKLGLFFLGRELDLDSREESAQPLLYKSKNLTTHAAIIGMTGSGKTGLGIGLIEEAIMDNIPSIIIDPKGDMGNLLLTFPKLQPADFSPWIDPAEADKKGVTPEQFAADQAEMWEKGLQSWGQDNKRIASLREKTEFTIYTPGSSAGVSVSVLDSFSPPPTAVLQDSDTLNGLVDSVVSGLLSLVDIKQGTKQSREYVLLSSLFLHYWRKGEGLDMEGLIGNIVNPPFKKVGVFGLDTFYSQSDRMELAMQLNSVIASPSFAAWTQGEPLDIQRILYGQTGKPQTAIFSIAHLSESERMFFVTMLLNRFIGWMRRQEGTSSLKALLYMDEIFGYFPPTANPPSKKPMLLLLKQARAYGIGVVLATQNPVDLDYKGLSNIGTWFVGRLQTTQDQNRVVDGIAGMSEGILDKSSLRKLLTDMQGRQFLLRSAHLDEPILFATRWVLSYLKGPISLPDIKRLMEKRKSLSDSVGDELAGSQAGPLSSGSPQDHPPLLANTIKQRFYLHPIQTENYLFEPWLLAKGSVRHFNVKRNIDEVVDVSLRIYLDDNFLEPDWSAAEENPYRSDELSVDPPDNCQYYPLASTFIRMRDFRPYTKLFADYLYQSRELELYRVAGLKIESRPGEDLADFRVRMADKLRENKDEAVEKLQERYKVKTERLEKKIDTALQKVEKEKVDVKSKTTDTILSFGSALLGAFFGRKSVSVSTISKASTGIKNVGRLAKEKGEVKRAEANVLKLQEGLERLAEEIESKATQISEKFSIENYTVETFSIKPRRSDIYDLDLCLLWEMVPPMGER